MHRVLPNGVCTVSGALTRHSASPRTGPPAGHSGDLHHGKGTAMDETPFISQTERTRCAVEGHLVDGGGTCTVVLIRDPAGWIFYPHGNPGMAVLITSSDATTVATTILEADR